MGMTTFLFLTIFVIFTNALINEEKLIKGHLDKYKTSDILNELHKCQEESHEIIKSLHNELAQLRFEVHKNDVKDVSEDVEEFKRKMKIELDELRKEIVILKNEKNDDKDNKDITEDVEELKMQMENRKTEIGILQDYDFENDFKIQNIEKRQYAHDKDINELSIEIDQLSYEVNVNITDVKNDLSNQISNMVIAPIGTIQGWSPIPEIGIENPVSLPKCWVTCDGSLINEGIWAGHHSPDLNNANR